MSMKKYEVTITNTIDNTVVKDVFVSFATTTLRQELKKKFKKSNFQIIPIIEKKVKKKIVRL